MSLGYGDIYKFKKDNTLRGFLLQKSLLFDLLDKIPPVTPSLHRSLALLTDQSLTNSKPYPKPNPKPDHNPNPN